MNDLRTSVTVFALTGLQAGILLGIANKVLVLTGWIWVIAVLTCIGLAYALTVLEIAVILALKHRSR